MNILKKEEWNGEGGVVGFRHWEAREARKMEFGFNVATYVIIILSISSMFIGAVFTDMKLKEYKKTLPIECQSAFSEITSSCKNARGF